MLGQRAGETIKVAGCWHVNHKEVDALRANVASTVLFVAEAADHPRAVLVVLLLIDCALVGWLRRPERAAELLAATLLVAHPCTSVALFRSLGGKFGGIGRANASQFTSPHVAVTPGLGQHARLIHRCYKADALAVGRPDELGHPQAHEGKLARLTKSVSGQQPELRLATACALLLRASLTPVGEESQPATVRRPARATIVLRPTRDLLRRAAVEWQLPDRRAVAVVGPIYGAKHKSGPLAVGRNLGVAQEA